MQRFGKSAQQKMMDRWGGGFILATILVILAAWMAGGSLGKWWSGRDAANMNNPGNDKGNMPVAVTEAKEFQMHFVRVGVFRSRANYMKAVSDMETAGMTAVIGPAEQTGTPVYVGPFMSADEAKTALPQIQAVKADYAKAYVKPVTVSYNPGETPAVTGAGASDLTKAMEAVNIYLHEVAMWMENKASNVGSDVTAITTQGQALDELATQLKDSTEAKAKEFAAIVSAAGTNAGAIAAVADATPSDATYQAAMSDYLKLVSQYNSFQAGK